MEKLAQTFGTLLYCASIETRDHGNAKTELMRGVARRLVIDLCQDDVSCSQCEEALIERWRLDMQSVSSM